MGRGVRVHGPWTRLVDTGVILDARVHGPYWSPVCPTRPVNTVPCIRAVSTARGYGRHGRPKWRPCPRPVGAPCPWTAWTELTNTVSVYRALTEHKLKLLVTGLFNTAHSALLCSWGYEHDLHPGYGIRINFMCIIFLIKCFIVLFCSPYYCQKLKFCFTNFVIAIQPDFCGSYIQEGQHPLTAQRAATCF